jgi:hypothetical protein
LKIIALGTSSHTCSDLQLISNALFTFMVFNINSLISASLLRAYVWLSSNVINDSYKKQRDALIVTFANVWYMADQEKRKAALNWPGWKKNAAFFGILCVIQGIPCVALTALYEWLGYERVEPMAISVGVVGISIV